MQNIDLIDANELAEHKAMYNLGFIPRPGLGDDRETQLARLRDFMVADRDEEAAMRARIYYGENLPIGSVSEESVQYFVGAAFARQNGIESAPEMFWHSRELPIPDVEKQDDLFELMGRELVTQTQQEWDAQKALADERVQAFDGMLRDIVQKADADGRGEDWAKFLDAYDRGVWGSKEETEKLAYSVRNAAEAFGMMLGMMDEYTDAGANVLTDSTSAVLMLDRLRGDEVAEGLFFGALQRQVQENLDEAQQKAFWERFGRAFSASTKELTAGLMGGHFKAFVTDEQVDEYNAELEKARKVSGLKRPNVSLYAEGDNWLEKVLPVGNARLKMVRTAARESGQLNEDGSLRYMSDEERMSTEELNAFRGKLYNAVNGIYDVKGAAALLGRMAPTSMAYLLPGGAIASGVSMYTQNLAQQLGEGETWTRSSTVGAVNAMIQASVEKIAFGSLNPGKMVPGLDRLMSHRLMARALGGIYGTTAGRVGMNVLAGAAEEAFVEPTAGLLLAGIYNAFSSDYFDLDDPVGEYRKEITEMLQPDQLLATALYGLLLGGVTISGHKKAAVDYSVTRSMLMEMGVEEGRAAQVARIDDPVARAKATQELIGQQLKVDAKGVLGYMAELYPQLQDMATVENYFDKGKLPKILPGESGMVRVREKDADGKVTEVQLSEESAGLLVQARMEVLTAREMTDMADMVLGAAMVGNLKQDGNRWQVEEVGERMDYAYFQRLSRAAGVKLANGAKESAVDKSVHEFLPLGTLARQGRDWENRMRVYRHDLEQKLGRELTEEEWQVEEKKAFSRVNRSKMRGRDGGVRTLLRVARGGFTAMEVLEDVTEENLVRDMESNGRTLDYYTSNLQELELAMGKPGAFLRRLKDEADAFTSMDVVEAMGKLVQSKVLADTARSGNRLSAALNAFLDMLRSWVLRAKAMFELGTRLNQLLEDKVALAKVESEFLADIDRLVAQDVEWLESLQLKEGLEAMFRAANAAAATATPVLDEAEAEHGEAVRAEIAAKEELQRKVDADVAAGEAALEGDMSSSVVNQQELDDIKAAAERDGTFMKAPNGKPTKLTERQWLQVRTGAFKGWFGDWKRAAELTFDGSEYNNETCLKMLASEAGTLFVNDETGIEAEINNRQRGKITSGKAQRKSRESGFSTGVHNFVAAHIRRLFKHAVHVGDYRDKNQSDDVLAIKRFVCPVRIKGVEAFAYMTVKELKQHGHKIYTLELDTIERLGGNLDEHFEEMLNPAPSKDIVARVKTLSKTYFEDISKVVDENGEPLLMYHGSPVAGIREFIMSETLYGKGSFFTSSPEEALEEYTGLNPDDYEDVDALDAAATEAGLLYEVFLNIRDSDRFYDKSGGVKHARVITPNEIKSATDNRGAFDGDEADMTMSVTDAQERGLFEDGVLETSNAVVVEPGATFSVTALHATPHRFRKFTTDNMGTGEGNQAFGWGLYFAESEKVNRDYYQQFSLQTGEFFLDGKRVRELDLIEFLNDHVESVVADYALNAAREDGNIDYRIKNVQAEKKQYEEWLKKPLDSPYAEWQLRRFIAGNKAQLKALRFVKKHKIKRVGATNYRVELNVDDSNLLMWDIPVSDELQREIEALQRQPDKEELEAVFAEMKAMGISSDGPKPENMHGYQVYNELVRILEGNVQDLLSPKFGQGPKLASEWLLAHGIKGIKYFDGFSRYGKGEAKTYNYVIFSGDDVKITGVNETGDYNAEWEDYVDPTASFSVVGPSAANWDEIKDRAFAGRDDGKLRVELDTSGVRLKKAPRHRTDDSVAKDLLRRLAVWRAAVAERGRLKAVQRAVKDEVWMADIMPELTYLVRQMSWMGLDYKSFSDMQGAGLIELAMNEDATLEEAKAAVKGRKVKGVLGFNKLGEVLDFPELYAAYPELQQMPVRWMDDEFNLRGSYSPDEERSVRKISVRANRSQGGILSTLLHEVQHWIQDKEGFSFGAMPEQSLVERGIPEGMPVYQLAAGEIEARNVQTRRWMSAEERAAMPFNETLAYPGQALSYTLDDLRSTMSVTNAQEQGLFKDGVLETENAVVVEPGATFSVTALHATPHRFRKFTTDNMGTGEGNRAFGWGLYFAESEKVNKNYYQYFTKNAQQPTLYVIAGDIVSFEDWKKYVNSLIDKVVGDKLYNRDSLVYSFMFKDEKEGSKLLASRRKLLRENKRRLKEEKEAEYKELWASNIELMNDSIEIISAMLSDGVFAKKTAMNYRVELNVDASNLFDWDNVVGSEIYEEVDKLGGVYNLSMDKEKATGAGVYRILSLLLGSDKAASEWLAERGYKGIKYLDGNSRQKVKGTYNYVIFSGDDVKITGVNETGDYNAEWEDYVDETASFSVSDTLMEDIAMSRKRAKNADGTISQDGEMSRNEEVKLCSMPDFMRFLGEPDVPVVARVFTLRKLLTDHKLTDELTYEVVQKMNDPVLAIQETPLTYLVLLHVRAENKDGVMSPVVCAVEHKKGKDGNRYLVSAYSLDKNKETKITQQFKKLVYCKYNETAKFTADAPQGSAYELLRAAISGGHTVNVPCQEDVVKWKNDFSASLVSMDEERLVSDMVAAGGGFKANVEFTEKMVKEMRNTLQRLRRLSGKTLTDREDAIAAMGSIVHMVKAVVQYLPKGYRFSVHPYLNKLETLAEMAATGDIDLTEDIAPKDVVDMEGSEGMNRRNTLDEMVKEYGNVKLVEALERIINRVNEQLRKHAKDKAVAKIEDMLNRLTPKKDKSGKLKGGKMSADAYRDLNEVEAAMKMDEKELKAKLSALNAELAEPGVTEEKRAKLESLLAIYDQFGCVQNMTASEAVAALEALRQRVWMHRFEWDNIMANRRAAQSAVAASVVQKVGDISANEYNAAKRPRKPTKRLKNAADILAGLPQVLMGMKGYQALWEMADSLTRRVNKASELLKQWESERWAALEALSKKTLKKSWRKCMDIMHKVESTGVAFEQKEFRKTREVSVAELEQLLAMSKAERKTEMDRREKEGGVVATTVLSEKAIAALQAEMLRLDAEGKSRKWIEVEYVEKTRREDDLKLSRGEALYAILMYEQPRYTERMEKQGYTPEVIAGFREFVGEGMLEFGYGLRELFAIQGDKVAAVYEAAFGVPFPREENYFAARWDMREKKGGAAEQLLAGMAGTPGASNGWMKQRVDHNLELDMTKDALQVFLQATHLTDHWMATQDIVADFKAWTRNKEFVPALTTLLGNDGYNNLSEWIDLLELGGVRDCLNMDVSQKIISGLYGTGSVVFLGLQVRTLIRQLPSLFNGLLGAHDISSVEWVATLAKMKHGEAPMTYKRMVDSVLIKNRQKSREGTMAGQATRPGDMQSSVAEDIMMNAMLPMEWVDAHSTAISLVPVWNVYYARAVKAGASHEEAERIAWEDTSIVANRSAQPVGFLDRGKYAQNRHPLVKSFFYMLSENTAKFALCRELVQGGHKLAATRAWLMYGAANAAISALLDYLQGDPEEWEKGEWWEYLLAMFYGPLAGIPGVGELLEAATTVLLQLGGEALDIEWMKKGKGRASVGRAFIDIYGAIKALENIYGFLTDDEEHGLAEYSRAASTVSRTLAIGTGWMGNAFGYWSTVVAIATNPIDFAARVWRNMKHYYGEE